MLLGNACQKSSAFGTKISIVLLRRFRAENVNAMLSISSCEIRMVKSS